MSEIDEIRLEQAEKIYEEAQKDKSRQEEELQEYAEMCLNEALAAYIGDDRNYVVDKAWIQCSMVEEEKAVRLAIENDGKTRLGRVSSKGMVDPVERDTTDAEKGLEKSTYFEVKKDPITRKLYALHATESSANGIRLATVIDRTCLRDVEEKKEQLTTPTEGNLSCEACIVSCGNCGIFRESDIDEIEKRMDKSKEYGTCYSLIKPVAEWTNARCTESIVGGHNDNNTPGQILSEQTCIGSSVVLNKPRCQITEHHKTMKFDTKYGKKEGLTMLSTLLCTRGGIITVKWHGQNNEGINIEMALDKMTEYLQGKGVSEEELHSVIVLLANNCGLTVNDMVYGDFRIDEAHERSIKYDEQIIAWTYYWNVKIQKEFKYSFTIDPNIVKAIIAQETSFGLVDDDNAAKNPSRNVMQSLAVGNDTVWIASGINPFHDGMFSVGDDIAYKMLDGTVKTDGYLVGKKEKTGLSTTYMDKVAFQKYRNDLHYDDFDILKDIFEIGEDGKYMVVFDNVTPDMSIATGIGCLINKIKGEGGNIYYGVRDYNSRDNSIYPELINQHLENMGCDKMKP